MLVLLSPAKTLDFESPLPAGVSARSTRPAFLAEARRLNATLARLAPAEVASLMRLSDALATRTLAWAAAWSTRTDARHARPAVLAYAGDVYAGLQARTLDADDLDWAQQRLVILSGLYGTLRPLDAIQPYRLEMATPLVHDEGRGVAAFWAPRLARHLNARAAEAGHRLVVDLASQEYGRAIDRDQLALPRLECVFEDWHRGAWRVLGLHAKRARGALARWIIRRRIEAAPALREFDELGYTCATAACEPLRLVFRRRSTAP